MKTSELTGAALDWAVAKCESDLTLHKDSLLNGVEMDGWWISGHYMDPNQWVRLGRLRFSTDWAQGGPIIEREKIEIYRFAGYWGAKHMYGSGEDGPTPLVAAMRAFVASKLGDEVDIPEELMP